MGQSCCCLNRRQRRFNKQLRPRLPRRTTASRDEAHLHAQHLEPLPGGASDLLYPRMEETRTAGTAPRQRGKLVKGQRQWKKIKVQTQEAAIPSLRLPPSSPVSISLVSLSPRQLVDESPEMVRAHELVRFRETQLHLANIVHRRIDDDSTSPRMAQRSPAFDEEAPPAGQHPPRGQQRLQQQHVYVGSARDGEGAMEVLAPKPRRPLSLAARSLVIGDSGSTASLGGAQSPPLSTSSTVVHRPKGPASGDGEAPPSPSEYHLARSSPTAKTPDSGNTQDEIGRLDNALAVKRLAVRGSSLSPAEPRPSRTELGLNADTGNSLATPEGDGNTPARAAHNSYEYPQDDEPKPAKSKTPSSLPGPPPPPGQG